jgi:hypothetical protein
VESGPCIERRLGRAQGELLKMYNMVHGSRRNPGFSIPAALTLSGDQRDDRRLLVQHDVGRCPACLAPLPRCQEPTCCNYGAGG